MKSIRSVGARRSAPRGATARAREPGTSPSRFRRGAARSRWETALGKLVEIGPVTAARGSRALLDNDYGELAARRARPADSLKVCDPPLSALEPSATTGQTW